MSTFLLWTAVGIAALLIACYVHGDLEPQMSRAKFVFLALAGFGSIALGYVAVWALFNQRPTSFELTHVFAFGVTMWVTALTYSVTLTLSRDNVVLSR